MARTRWWRLNASSFGRDIAVVLVLKMALILALYQFVIRPALHPTQGPVATAAAVAGSDATYADEVER